MGIRAEIKAGQVQVAGVKLEETLGISNRDQGLELEFWG